MSSTDQNQQPLSTQGDADEKEDQLGGTTNLSLDQLKKEGDSGSPAEDNLNRLDNADDLHEIQAGDDLNEPRTDDENDLTVQQ
jgi:hypothetical protein